MEAPTREDAWTLLNEFISSENLIKHCLAVEGVMGYLARKYGEDEQKWRAVGLVHDVDYEKYPDEHPNRSRDILSERGWPEEHIRAVESHGYIRVNDVEPRSLMERSLFAIDELTGLITATALVRPSKSVLDMKAKSVKKKWSDKRFSANVDREIIQKGADMLGVELSELITDTIMGMREVADEIGLKGEAGAEN
jgi:putative nucleotidyltransferase with HDIG domain